MDQSQVVLEELKIVEDISHSLDLYKLDELLTEEETNEAVGILSGLSKDYRHVHVELKTTLGDDYVGKYPKYDVMSGKMNTYIKSAKSKIRVIKNENQESKNLEVQKQKNYDDKQFFEVEALLLTQKVAQRNEAVDVLVVKNENEINEYISKMEGFINEFFALSAKMKHAGPDVYSQKFEKDCMYSISEIQQDIKMAKLLKQKFFEVNEYAKNFSRFQNERLKHVTSAENLNTEISYRFKFCQKNMALI